MLAQNRGVEFGSAGVRPERLDPLGLTFVNSYVCRVLIHRTLIYRTGEPIGRLRHRDIGCIDTGTRARTCTGVGSVLARRRATRFGHNEGTGINRSPGDTASTRCRATAKVRTLFNCLCLDNGAREVGRLFTTVASWGQHVVGTCVGWGPPRVQPDRRELHFRVKEGFVFWASSGRSLFSFLPPDAF